MSFKMRVTGNIGIDSTDTFGGLGTVYEVREGTFKDMNGRWWYNDEEPFTDLDSVNNFLYRKKNTFTTKFERVEGRGLLNKSTLSEDSIIETAEGKLYEYKISDFYDVKTRALHLLNGSCIIGLSEYNGGLIHRNDCRNNIVKIYSKLELKRERDVLVELELLLEEAKISHYTEEDIMTRLKAIIEYGC